MTKTAKLVIFGAGETAKLAYEYFTFDSEYEVVAFAVDAAFRSNETFLGLPVVTCETMPKLYSPDIFRAFVAMASGELNYQRARMFARVKAMGYLCASYISSRAFVWPNVKIGENCLILEDNTLQPFTRVEDNVVMWSGNHLGHRSVIGQNCFITSHVVISGFCTIGANTFIGVNSSIADNVSIGRDNFIAMGSCLNKNTAADEIWRGNPAAKAGLSARVFCHATGV